MLQAPAIFDQMGRIVMNPKSSNTTQRQFKTRLVRGKPADRQFDIDFWQEQGDEAIFAAAWEMILIAEDMKHGKQPTFQRTVTKLKRS